MRTTLFATAALLGLGFGQAFASVPVRTASEATGVETTYRVASWDKFHADDHTRRAQPGENTADNGASRIDTEYGVAQAEQTGVNNANLT